MGRCHLVRDGLHSNLLSQVCLYPRQRLVPTQRRFSDTHPRVLFRRFGLPKSSPLSSKKVSISRMLSSVICKEHRRSYKQRRRIKRSFLAGFTHCWNRRLVADRSESHSSRCFYGLVSRLKRVSQTTDGCAEQGEVLFLANEIETTVIRPRIWESIQESSRCYRAC